MPNIKAVIDFSGYTAEELAPVAQQILDRLTENTADFPIKPVSLADFGTALTDYNTKLVARQSKATSDMIAFTVSRHALEEVLYEWGNQVNNTANGDPVLVDKSGFPSYDTARTIDYSAPAAPTDVRMRQGDTSGSWVARFKPGKQRSTNQAQTCTGDPNDESAWKEAGIFQGGKAFGSGVTPGTVLWFRVRTVGLRNVMGAWSDPAKIMVV